MVSLAGSEFPEADGVSEVRVASVIVNDAGGNAEPLVAGSSPSPVKEDGTLWLVCLGRMAFTAGAIGVPDDCSAWVNSPVARLALDDEICDSVIACVELSDGLAAPSSTGQKLHVARLASQ